MAMPTPTPLCARYNHRIARCYAFAIVCCCFVLGPKHFPFSIVSYVSLDKRCLLNVLENVIHFLLPPLLLLLLVPLHIFSHKIDVMSNCWRKKRTIQWRNFMMYNAKLLTLIKCVQVLLFKHFPSSLNGIFIEFSFYFRVNQYSTQNFIKIIGICWLKLCWALCLFSK